MRDIVQLTDAGGTVADEYRFDAWGNTLANTGSTVNPYHYKGQLGYYRDPDLAAEESSFYLHHRQLDPTSGRFRSQDPAEDDLNSYRYVRNNPVNEGDPSGLRGIKLQQEAGVTAVYQTFDSWLSDYVLWAPESQLIGFLENGQVHRVVDGQAQSKSLGEVEKEAASSSAGADTADRWDYFFKKRADEEAEAYLDHNVRRLETLGCVDNHRTSATRAANQTKPAKFSSVLS